MTNKNDILTAVYEPNYESLIREKELKTFLHELECPQCKGELKWNGTIINTSPLLYHHACNSCKYAIDIHEKYPHQVYKEID